jgi:hypothetical protein
MKGVFNDYWPRRGTSQTEKRKGFGESRVRGGIRTKIIDDYGGLHNRLTRQVYLRPFSLAECEALVRANGHIMNRDQILEGYMVMGGVPYYWDLLRKDISLAQNIDALFFAPHGELSDEFDHLFLALFRKPALYMSVIRALGTKKCGMTRNEIIAATHTKGNGRLSRILRELAQCDLIRVYAEPGRRKRDLIYQLIDNYVLFYFRFIDGQTNTMPNFWSASQTTQAVRVWCGLAFERVALQHIDAIKRKLGTTRMHPMCRPLSHSTTSCGTKRGVAGRLRDD